MGIIRDKYFVKIGTIYIPNHCSSSGQGKWRVILEFNQSNTLVERGLTLIKKIDMLTGCLTSNQYKLTSE